MRTGIIVLSLLAVLSVASALDAAPAQPTEEPVPIICPQGTDGIVTLLPGTPKEPSERGQAADDCFLFNTIHTANQSSPMTGDNWDPLEVKDGTWNFITGRFRANMFDDNFVYALSSDNFFAGTGADGFLTVGGSITITSPNLNDVFTCFPTLYLDSRGNKCMRSNGIWKRHLSLWCGNSAAEDFAGITLGIDFRFDLGSCEPFVPDATCADWIAEAGEVENPCGLNLAYASSRAEHACGGGENCIVKCCVPDLCPESTSTLLTLRPVGPPSDETLVKADESQISGLDDCFNWNLLHTATEAEPIVGTDTHNFAVLGGSWDYATGAFSAKLLAESVLEDSEGEISNWSFSGSLFPDTSYDGIVKRLLRGSLSLKNEDDGTTHAITCHAELYDETFYPTALACMRSNTYLDNYISLWCGDTEDEKFKNVTVAIDFRFAWSCDSCKPYKVDCGCKKVVLPAGSGDGCNCLEFRSKEESLANGQIDCVPTKDEL